MTRQAIHNTSPSDDDKKFDQFLQSLSGLVANAVADGIKAGLKAQGVVVNGEKPEATPNSVLPAFRGNGGVKPSGDGLAAYKLPRAEG